MRHPGDLIIKDPDAIEPQGCDWTAWLAELGAGVTIATSVWAIDGGPDAVLVLSNPTILPGNLKTQIMLSGGTVGVQYLVRNRIVTTTSPTSGDDRSFTVLVQNR